jgi:hypothetical protein
MYEFSTPGKKFNGKDMTWPAKLPIAFTSLIEGMVDEVFLF